MNSKILLLVLFTAGYSIHAFAQNSYEAKYISTYLDGAKVLLETQKIYPDYLISHLTTASINSITSLSNEELRAAIEKASLKNETLVVAIDHSLYIMPGSIDFDLFKAHDSEIYYRTLMDSMVESKKPGNQDSMLMLLVRDSLIQLNWSIENEYKMIDGIKCRKATMTYRCKDYVAWFDPNTPVPIGPEQFGGLPGIIVEMSRSIDNVIWQLQSFNPITDKDKVDLKELKSSIDQTSSISWCEYGILLQDWVDYLKKLGNGEDCKTCPSNFTFTFYECFDDCR